ncbi:MAG: redoxin domain-containing protein [Acidobacteria bacterium]|nr:redoxin domain-containing protein [Acidobacteriota bacterium]
MPAPTSTVLSLTVAPDFTLMDQRGQPVRLSDYRGKKVVIAFYRGYW